MKLLGLNSPEIFIILVILLLILGPKRIEKGFLSFKKLLKFLLTKEESEVREEIVESEVNSEEPEESEVEEEIVESEVKVEEAEESEVKEETVESEVKSIKTKKSTVKDEIIDVEVDSDNK